MQKGLVSVLCLSMNHDQYVEQGYSSVLNQTYRNLEILYVDNNSKDKTFEIADKLFRNSGLPYKGFKRTESYGISANLNFLLKEATGEFIAVLSGDDWWENDNLKLKIDCFNSDSGYGLVYGNGYKYFELEKKQHVFYTEMQKSGFLFNDLLKGNLFFAGSVVSRYEALKEIGFFDENLPMEDWDMYLRMAEKYKIGYVHQPITYSRVTGKNLSSNIEFMDKGYEFYFKKYAKYPEIAEAKKNIKLAHAYQLARYSPGLKSLKYIIGNMQWSSGYFKQVIRCLAGMTGIRIRDSSI
ncbi:MAG: glycosyltransferase family A protein [Bacteroidota bacterium]